MKAYIKKQGYSYEIYNSENDFIGRVYLVHGRADKREELESILKERFEVLE